MRRPPVLLALTAALPAAALAAADPKPAAPAKDAAGLAFFENKIRPVLVKHCYSCHSAETKKGPKGGLRVDTRAELLKGGDGGPAVVPGRIGASLLIKALKGDDDLPTMPPDEKLSAEVIADFEKWVKMGAPDPRDASHAGAVVGGAKLGMSVEEGRKFWSFVAPAALPAPAVKDAAWPRTDIDHFILSKLEAKGLTPTADADPYVLVRRLHVDLIGLPPAPEDVDAFVEDYKANPKSAVAMLADRLLASPRFGERWGRHWLDVARYADSNGKDENLTFHEAWVYRDYVIRSFNADKPYDRFVKEQLAGDLMPADTPAARDEQLTGTGFLILGPKVLADRDKVRRRMDVVDEQIDTVGRAFLGLTLGCARCHDHKFDPVPTADYYALAGIFLSTHTLDNFKAGNPVISGWTLRPLGGEAGEQAAAAAKAHAAKLKQVADAIKKAKAELGAAQDKAAMRVPAGLTGVTVDDDAAVFVGSWKPSSLTRPYVGGGYRTDEQAGKGQKTATYTPKLPRAGEYEVLLSYTANTNRASNVPVTVTFDGGETTVTLDQTKPPKVDGLFQPVGTFKFAAGTAGKVTIGTAGTSKFVLADAVRFVPAGELAKQPEMNMGVPAETKAAVESAEARLKKLEAEEAALKKAAPPAPRLAMAARDEDAIEDAKINVRGNPYQLGAQVPRGFLQVATTGTRPTLPADQSGRLQLAEWAASKDNPLTARVAVNRVWAHLFGEGIVRSVDNLGVQGERPTHPELLDTLAVNFVADGWSVKRLIRTIVTSRAYQQAATGVPPAALAADPENKLFGRANRRRVEAEVIRDSILAVSGKLDLNGGGSSVAGMGERAIDNSSSGGVNSEGVQKRAVYLPVIRNDVPTLFEVFDFADPDVSTGKRDATTVSTQALYLMNSTFANAQAKAAAERLLADETTDAARVTRLFRRALGRTPTADEAAATAKFLADYKQSLASQGSGKAPKNPDLAAWQAVCLSVFGCNEFRYVE